MQNQSQGGIGLTAAAIRGPMTAMPKPKPGWWTMNLALAAAVLHDRTLRRRAMMRFVILLLAMFALGLWGIDRWLLASPLRFVLWWGACALLAVFVILFAAYDMCAVIREERARFLADRWHPDHHHHHHPPTDAPTKERSDPPDPPAGKKPR